MSNVYNTEPPTSGKVILITTFGNIDIELWTREAPKACRNFLALCLSNYYDNNIFFRIIKDFMIQTGDPTNTGKGGESIYKKEFQDEFHSRLKFSHRGIVAMANKNIANTNGSQFFITLDKCPWLDKKHTIFGKVTGDTIFNAINIGDIETKNEFPKSNTLPMIIRVEVLINPFEDLYDDVIKNSSKAKNLIKDANFDNTINEVKQKEKLKNVNLISFYEEDEEEENKVESRIKPIHDVVRNNKFVNNVINDEEIKIRKVDNINKKNYENKSESEESSSESESEISQGINNAQNSQNDLDGERKLEILKLKKDIINIKKKLEGKNIEEDKQKTNLNPLEKHQEKYLHLKKKKQRNTSDTIEKINIFKSKLIQNIKTEDNWMSNKLKFQIDSQNAYSLNEMREKQAKNFN